MSETAEISVTERQIRDFLTDLRELCKLHEIEFYSLQGSTIIEHRCGSKLLWLEADSEIASLYWPRINADIVVK